MQQKWKGTLIYPGGSGALSLSQKSAARSSSFRPIRPTRIKQCPDRVTEYFLPGPLCTRALLQLHAHRPPPHEVIPVFRPLLSRSSILIPIYSLYLPPMEIEAILLSIKAPRARNARGYRGDKREKRESEWTATRRFQSRGWFTRTRSFSVDYLLARRREREIVYNTVR